MKLDEKYWSERYKNDQTGWDIGYASDPIRTYIDQLEDKSIKILIPGCGNSYEAEYIHSQGFANTYVIDLSYIPLDNFAKRYPLFPKEHLIQGNFFDLSDQFDLIVEQTFFCSLHPDNRGNYARKVSELLTENGRLVGVLFNDALFSDHPPFGGFNENYTPHFAPFFDFKVFELCYNSIKPRAGRELFINLVKK